MSYDNAILEDYITILTKLKNCSILAKILASIRYTCNAILYEIKSSSTIICGDSTFTKFHESTVASGWHLCRIPAAN